MHSNRKMQTPATLSTSITMHSVRLNWQFNYGCKALVSRPEQMSVIDSDDYKGSLIGVDGRLRPGQLQCDHFL